MALSGGRGYPEDLLLTVGTPGRPAGCWGDPGGGHDLEGGCVTEYEVGGRLPEEALLVDFLCLSPALWYNWEVNESWDRAQSGRWTLGPSTGPRWYPSALELLLRMSVSAMGNPVPFLFIYFLSLHSFFFSIQNEYSFIESHGNDSFTIQITY